jgi:transglutaminase-like putative cysteine protease
MTQERRMTITAAVAVVLASTVIFPLFSGSVWFYAGTGAVLTVAISGTLSRIRTLPVLLCLAISLVGLLLYLNLVFEASQSYLKIIPSPASLASLGRLVRDGMNEASKYAPGAPNVKGLVLLAAGGIGIAAVFTDLIAVRMRSTALAGLPLLVLFTVPVTMSTGRSQLATAVIFCLGTSGYLAMLSADGRERIRVWGRLISLWRTHEGELSRFGAPALATAGAGAGSANGHGRPTANASANGAGAETRSPYRVLRGPDTRALAAAGRRVGIASVVLALCAPLLVPGLHAGKLLSSDWGFGSGSSGAGTIMLPDPLNATAQELKDNKGTVVMTYTTTASSILQQWYPAYLQQDVFDTLTDSVTDPWQLLTNQTVMRPFDEKLPTEQALTIPGSPKITTNIAVAKGAAAGGSGPNFLPLPYPPLQLTGEKGTWEVDPSTQMVFTKNGTLADQSYQVVSLDPDPTPSQLDALHGVPSDAADVELPAQYSQKALENIAHEQTKGAKTEFQKAHDLENWLGGRSTTQFSYNTSAPHITSGNSLLEFLTQTKSGDCVQYSFAFTVLARLLGLPTRLVTGYTAGTQNGNHYVVKSTDAHAWPEVLFPGYGWIRFEPTPAGQGTAQPNGYSVPAGAGVGAPPVEPNGSPASTPASSSDPSGNSNLRRIGGRGDGSGAAGISAAKKVPAGTPWTAILLAVLAAIALAGGVIAIAAPAALRALSARPDSGPRQRNGGAQWLTTAVVVLAVAGVVALALYRLLSRTKGLSLSTGWATVGIAFGAAALVVLAVPTICRIILRRWRWMRASDDTERAHAAWLELRADLADFGVGYLPSESPRALAGRLRGELTLPEPAAEAIGRIAMAEERATYAARPADSGTLRQDGAEARRGIAGAAGSRARWRSRILPASVMGVVADGTARVSRSWTSRTWLRWASEHV